MLAVLPTRARLKLNKWQSAVSDGDALLSALRERRDAAEGAQLMAAQRLARAKKDRYVDAARLKQLEAEAEATETVLAQVYAEGQQRMAARDRSRFLAERCLEWLRLVINEGVTADDGPRWVDAELDAKPEDGQSFEEAVAATRREIYDLQRRRSAGTSATATRMPCLVMCPTSNSKQKRSGCRFFHLRNAAMIGLKVLPTSWGGGMEAGTCSLGKSGSTIRLVNGTYTRKCPELTQLTGPPRLAAPFFMMQGEIGALNLLEKTPFVAQSSHR
jgi:hypothetical protein